MAFQHIAILGAGGKMGSRIALLLLLDLCFKNDYVLTLLDVYPDGFLPLKKYLKNHLTSKAEKSINLIRQKFTENLEIIDNGDMIQAFVEEAMDRVRFATSTDDCKDVNYVFEAIIEDIDVKAKLLKKIKEVAPNAYFFSNTSSIPIHKLAEKCGLETKLLGFHFYNPPTVQKLVEIILPKRGNEALKKIADDMGRTLGKTLVYSNDIAGFIGNGYFIREIMSAGNAVKLLEKEMSFTDSISFVNSVFQDFLLRPMGIFQLIDYVGIDVCVLIAKIMTEELKSNFLCELLVSMCDLGVKGGQYPEGGQKDGFFKYEKGKIAGVYDPQKKCYVDYKKMDECGLINSWKALVTDKDRQLKIDQHFVKLQSLETKGSKLAFSFLNSLCEIIEGLVQDKVADNYKDVETVLTLGFYHLYVPKKTSLKEGLEFIHV